MFLLIILNASDPPSVILIVVWLDIFEKLIWRHFSSLVLSMVILFLDIRKQFKTSRKVGLVDQKQQQEQTTISSVTSLWDRKLTALNITAQLNQSREKMC